MGNTADTKASWNHAQVAVSLAEGNLLCPSLNTRGTKFNVNWMPKFSRNWRLQTLATRRNITKVRSFYWTEINIMLSEKDRWDAVDCSIQEPLACNSDDEKCIKRAVKESKALKLESKKPAKSRSPLSLRSRTILNNSFMSRRVVIPASRPKVELGPSEYCFHCGRSGHFAQNCQAPIPVSSAGKTFWSWTAARMFQRAIWSNFWFWWSFCEWQLIWYE